MSGVPTHRPRSPIDDPDAKEIVSPPKPPASSVTTWKHFREGRHEVYPASGGTRAASSAAAQLINSGTSLPSDLPHPTDEDFATHLRSFATSAWLNPNCRIRPKETLDAWSQRVLGEKGNWTPPTITLAQNHREGATRRLIYAYRLASNFSKQAHANLEAYVKEANALATANARIKELEKQLRQAQKPPIPGDYAQSPLGEESSGDILSQIQFFVDKPEYLQLAPTTSLTTFFQKIRDEVADLEEQVDSAETQSAKNGLDLGNLRILYNKAIAREADWEVASRLLDEDTLPALDSSKPGGPGEPKPLSKDNLGDPVHLAVRLAAIRSACRAGNLAAMTQHLNFLPDAGTGVIPAVWNAIPTELRGNNPQPRDLATLNTFLNQIPLGTCNHPPELAAELHMEPATPWSDSLDVVRDLMTAAPQPAIAGRSTLFKATEVPALKDTARYEEYRGQLKVFFESEDDPALHEYGRAMRRVIRGFEDTTAIQAAQGWDVSTCVRPTWHATWQAFIAALDEKFQKVTILEDTIGDFMKCRPKDAETPSDFFNRFEAITNQRRVVEERKGIPAASRLSDETVTARLLAILPRYLVDDVRLSLARQNQIIELRTPAQLRPEFERAWAYVPAPYKPPKGPAHPVPKGRAGPPARPTSTTNEVKERTCGLIVSYDTAPAVPATLRGSLYSPQDPQSATRRQLAARMQVCEYCRRPRSEHHASGPRFKTVTPANAPGRVARGRQPSPPPGPRVQDITDQQAIEPAPAPPSA